MLENYHRQLSQCWHEVKSMQRHVQSKQDFMAISLDVHRNRMSKMNVHLGIGAVSLGICTTVAGYLGMNVTIPSWLVNLPHVFFGITFASVIAAAVTHALCVRWLIGQSSKKRAMLRFAEIQALQNMLRDMHLVDFALKSAEGASALTRAEFRAVLESVPTKRQVTDLEVDVLFRSLDSSGDGLLQPSELNLRSQTSVEDFQVWHVGDNPR